MVKIDGESFDIGIINITRKGTVEKELLGTTVDGRNHYNTTGTRYDYEVTFATKMMNVAEYDRLYEILTDPVDTHTVEMPYGQSTITFDASVTSASDSIVFNYNSMRRWSELKINFESAELSKVAE